MPEAGNWRVRYFAPETEIPFCGHATIALGAALAMREGDGRFSLKLNHAEISVEGRKEGELFAASLQSPGTRNRAATEVEIEQALALFNYEKDDLAPGIPPALIHAGADHIVLPLRSREKLASMHYDLSRGRVLMNRQGWTTILLINSETPTRFHSRNPFASGGVYEDPATVLQLPLSRLIYAISAGRMVALLKSFRARIWVRHRICAQISEMNAAAQSAFRVQHA